MATMKLVLNTLSPECYPVGVHLSWGGRSNNRHRLNLAGSIYEVSRLLPGLRYLISKNASRVKITEYASAWETWRVQSGNAHGNR